MNVVDLSNATASSTQAHTFYTEASDLGLPPGVWPRKIPVNQRYCEECRA